MEVILIPIIEKFCKTSQESMARTTLRILKSYHQEHAICKKGSSLKRRNWIEAKLMHLLTHNLYSLKVKRDCQNQND